MTGQQGFSWQGLAAYRYLSDSATSRRPGRELHVQVNSAPVDNYQPRRPDDLIEKLSALEILAVSASKCWMERRIGVEMSIF